MFRMFRTFALAGALALASIAAQASTYIGTTVGGGAYGQGAVIEWDGHGRPITLYSFCARNQCADGARPETNVIVAADGSIYGTTRHGGHGGGAIWHLTNTNGAWSEQVIFDFCEYFGQCGTFGGPSGTFNYDGRWFWGVTNRSNGRGSLWSFDGTRFIIHDWLHQ